MKHQLSLFATIVTSSSSFFFFLLQFVSAAAAFCVWIAAPLSLSLVLASVALTDACLRPFSLFKMQPEYINERLVKNLPNITIIDSNQTCNKLLNPNKTLVFCFHNGVCQSVVSPINQTHYQRIIYCVCQKVILR